jgi:hypothetical protein
MVSTIHCMVHGDINRINVDYPTQKETHKGNWIYDAIFIVNTSLKKLYSTDSVFTTLFPVF